MFVSIMAATDGAVNNGKKTPSNPYWPFNSAAEAQASNDRTSAPGYWPKLIRSNARYLAKRAKTMRELLARTGTPRGARAALELALVDHDLRAAVVADSWLELRVRGGRRCIAAIDLQRSNWVQALNVFLLARDQVDAARCGDLGELLSHCPGITQ